MVIAFLTALSHYNRPIVFLNALVLAWLGTSAAHYHDARVADRPQDAPARQVALDEALAQWG